MKRLFLLFVLFFISSAFLSSESSPVYICVSKTAAKYHFDRDCRGLGNCTHKIEKVSLERAKELGYSICGWED